ncbi:MAG TPA: aromatic amino acid transport family protein, partial [Thermomicrobiales bacterium]|nr:aromatic amino acid transport family protein [Thermomicrobiales bacterium]
MTDDLLTRDEVLGGLPARRAGALLFLIESRTAHLVQRARQAMAPFRTEEADRERELAFVEAFSLGREPPLRPTIQDLERHAPEWSDLVPENPRLRAAVAHLLGGKYQFTAGDVPRLRIALGLDTDVVRDAHQRLYRESIDTIYVERPSLAIRLRWARSSIGTRLETLPPFWTAFALTLGETVGSGILALPIALAPVGPLPGVILLILFGIINVTTVAWMAETTSRTAIIRYGGAYFGRMVKEYLGGAGALLLTMALLVNTVVGLLAYAIGISTTLASLTGIVGVVWVVVLFLVAGFMISRHTTNASVAAALVLGVVNLLLILILAGVGFVHLDTDNLAHMEIPGIGGSPLDLSVIGLAFGALLVAYFGHTSVGNCAAVVLQRDPTGCSL